MLAIDGRTVDCSRLWGAFVFVTIEIDDPEVLARDAASEGGHWLQTVGEGGVVAGFALRQLR
jgi:hypothetical protein